MPSFGFSTNWSYFPLTGVGELVEETVTGNINVTFYPAWYKTIGMEVSFPQEWGNCTYNVYRSESEEGAYAKVNLTPVLSPFFDDTQTQAYSVFNKCFYKIEVILPDGRKVSSTPKTWDTRPNDWVNIRKAEIQRREWLLLRKFVGIKSHIFRRKTYGKRCGVCWNYKLEKVMKDACENCAGTSFDGGYFEPYETLFQYEPTPGSPSWEYFGKLETNVIPAWTISIPQINGFDLVFREPDAALYSVQAIGTTELTGNVVRQLVQLRQIERQAPEYKLVRKVYPERFR